MKEKSNVTYSVKIENEKGEPFDIPEEGSLGLLALGYLGLMAWREKRKSINAQGKTESREKA